MLFKVSGVFKDLQNDHSCRTVGWEADCGSTANCSVFYAGARSAEQAPSQGEGTQFPRLSRHHRHRSHHHRNRHHPYHRYHRYLRHRRHAMIATIAMVASSPSLPSSLPSPSSHHRHNRHHGHHRPVSRLGVGQSSKTGSESWGRHRLPCLRQLPPRPKKLQHKKGAMSRRARNRKR